MRAWPRAQLCAAEGPSLSRAHSRGTRWTGAGGRASNAARPLRARPGREAGNLHSSPAKKGAGLAGERAATLQAERLSLALLTGKSLVSHRLEGEQLGSALLF